MNRTAVDSSNIRSVGYDPESKTLEIEFTTGAVYQYFDVAPETHEGLMNAGSIGSYFHKHIKPVYSGSRA